MVKNRNGVTLLELLISATLMIGVFLLIGNFLSQGLKEFFKLSKETDQRSDLALLSGHLQKYMATGDVRFFGFTNQTNDVLARFLIPQTGSCGDLTSDCSEDSSFLYIHYDKSTMPAVSAICLLGTQLEAGNIRSATFLVDGSNTAYGTVSQDISNGFNVGASEVDSTLPSGLVRIETNQMVALLDPPNATVWVSLGPPQKLNPVWTPLSQTFTPDLSPCLSLMQSQTPQPSTPPYTVPPYKVDALYSVKLKPYGMNQFTGESQTAITEAAIRNSVGRFPLRLFSAIPRTFGKYPALGSQAGFAEVRNCIYANDKLSCNGSGLLKVTDINRMRIDLSFHLSLTNSTNSSLGSARPLRYELRSSDMVSSESCRLDDCAFLPLANRTSIPYRLDLGSGLKEDFTSLSDLGYSWIKNLSISEIRFRLKSDKKEDYFDVYFR